MGTCLLRSNGFFSFLLIAFVFFLMWQMKEKRILCVFLIVILINFIMKHPVLAILNIRQPDTIESLAIPSQQIARVVKEGHELTDWETEKLEKIIDLDRISNEYLPGDADPIKKLVREKGHQDEITSSGLEYIKLYFQIGMKYPSVYLRAWIDQTKGYWNSGYDGLRWSTGLSENTFGIRRIIRSEFLERTLREYFWLYTELQGLQIFISIGVFVWIDLVCLFVAIIKRYKIGVFVTIPVLSIVVSLLIATPIASAIRYLYAVFCALPMIIIIVFAPNCSQEEYND